jgi:hypothetical protein
MSDETSQPVASGDLARTPFAHLVLYLYQRRSSGTLIVRDQLQEYRTLFHRGRAVAAFVPQPSAALDDSLIGLSALGSGNFEFHEADLVGSGPAVVTGMFDPFAFVVRAAREYALTETVDSVLAKYAGVPLALDLATDWTRLTLTPDELQLVAALKEAHATPEALLSQLPLERGAARRLLYSLLIIRAVLPETSSPDSASTPGMSAAPSGIPRSSRTSIAAASSASSASTPASRGSGDAWRAIASAAGAIAEGRPSNVPSMRPSRASSQSIPAQRGISRPLSQPLTAAGGFDQPSRPVSRPHSEPLSARPDSQRLSRDSLTGLPRARPSTPLPRGTPRPSLPDVETLDSDGKFRRVELLCQRNQFDDALPIIRALLETDRKNPKYLGMLAHTLLGKINDTNFGKELVDSVNQALRMDSEQVHALYTKARCYKRLGKEREALHYFRRTVAADPNHIEAAREARLLLSRMMERKKK